MTGNFTYQIPSNEVAFIYQLLVRSYGTNNLADCSNMCHESSGLAMKEAIAAAAYFPEANVLVPATSQATGSGTPTSKAVEIEITRSDLADVKSSSGQ